MSVCWWWQFDRSFPRIKFLVANTAISIISCYKIIHDGFDILVAAQPRFSWKLAVKTCHMSCYVMRQPRRKVGGTMCHSPVCSVWCSLCSRSDLQSSPFLYNNNTNICKAHIVSIRAESEAPYVNAVLHIINPYHESTDAR